MKEHKPVRTRSWVMAANVAILLAAAAPVLTAQSPSAKKPDAGTLAVEWRKRAADGQELGVATEIKGGVARVIGQKTRKDGKGAVAETRDVVGYVPQRFDGAETYYRPLDANVRAKTVYVEVKVKPAVVADPTAGTIITIDGAKVGFALSPNTTNGTSMLELLVQDLGRDGRPLWHKSGLFYAVRSNESPPVQFTVKLDRENEIWGLMLNNVMADDFIALPKGEDTPIFSIRAGAAAGASARLEMIEVSETKPPGTGRFGAGSISDLSEAHRGGAKGIAKNGELIPLAASNPKPPGKIK